MTTREEWLNAAVAPLTALFEVAGETVPPVVIHIGDAPRKAPTADRWATCCRPKRLGDAFGIWFTPVTKRPHSPRDWLGALVHELAHAVLMAEECAVARCAPTLHRHVNGDRHGDDFAALVATFGLQGPWTSVNLDPAYRPAYDRIAGGLGPFPEA